MKGLDAGGPPVLKLGLGVGGFEKGLVGDLKANWFWVPVGCSISMLLFYGVACDVKEVLTLKGLGATASGVPEVTGFIMKGLTGVWLGGEGFPVDCGGDEDFIINGLKGAAGAAWVVP